MLFRKRDWPRIADGSLTATYRTWSRPQAVAGRRYRTPVGFIEVTSVSTVADPPDAEQLRRQGNPDVVGAGPWTRVEFRYVGGPDPRDELAQDTDVDVAALDRRVGALRPVLDLIAERPGVRAADLAAAMGRERLPFKADVRKLKALGLTESLPVGYRLTPRGEAYLRCSR